MTWVLANLDLIAGRLGAHLALALPPIALSLVLAVPIAALANRLGRLRSPVIAGVALLYAIPSLPLFILLPTILGTTLTDPVNVIVALTLYGLALLVPATADALSALDRDVLSAAEALGMSPLQRLAGVALPLAAPGVLAAVRVVAVSSIALVTIGSVLGVPSLGSLLTDGFQRGLLAEVATGLVLTVVVALVVDALLAAIGRAVMPWTHLAEATA